MYVKLSSVDRDVPRGVAAAVAGGANMDGVSSIEGTLLVRPLLVGFFFSFFLRLKGNFETWERDDNDYDQCDEGGWAGP